VSGKSEISRWRRSADVAIRLFPEQETTPRGLFRD
jgi:hypothetical protein